MNTLKNIALVIIVIGLFLGIRYVSTAVRYGCADVPLENVDGGDDCPAALSCRFGTATL